MKSFSKNLSINYTEGENESPENYASLENKMEKAVDVCIKAFKQYNNPAMMWTGGKDSTLMLYIARDVAQEFGYKTPPAIFIDHFQHFEDITRFIEKWSNELGVTLHYARNNNVKENAQNVGNEIHVENLNDQNRKEVRDKLGYEEETFPFLLDTYVGNHLLKTVALNNTLKDLNVDGVFSGVRWDEQEARANETFFSPRHDESKYPVHDRIHPILQFNEKSVWDATWNYLVPDLVGDYPEGHVPQGYDDLPNGLSATDLPVSPKYFEGFRSLGSEVSTEKSSNTPAWLQNLEETTEREGRAQDKENLMNRLRDLGYM